MHRRDEEYRRTQNRTMIRLVVVLIIIIAVAAITIIHRNARGGSGTFAGTADGLEIEGEWKLRVTIEENGSVIECRESEHETYPEAAIVDASLVAKDGKLSLTGYGHDLTGTYKLIESADIGSFYDISMSGGGTEYTGMAVASIEIDEQEGVSAVLTMNLMAGDRNLSVFFDSVK